jgi:hypothetical protein
MHLGIIAGPDAVAVPACLGQAVDGPAEAALQQVFLPGAILGKALQRFPIRDAIEADQGLGDRMLFDVEGQASDPLDQAMLAGLGKAGGHLQRETLPDGPQLGSVHGAPPGYATAGFDHQLSP